MIKNHNGDIFTVPADVLIHQANCFNTMGGGIAALIRDKFPEAYKADQTTKKGDLKKLGKFTFAALDKPGFPAMPIKFIVNLYSQYDFAMGDRATSYDALDRGLRRVLQHFDEAQTFSVPHGIGCGLGGGSWTIVEAILKDIFEEHKSILTICKYEPPKETHAISHSGFAQYAD